MSKPTCPHCKGSTIQKRGDQFYCRRCGEEFAIRDGKVVTTKESPWRQLSDKND